MNTRRLAEKIFKNKVALAVLIATIVGIWLPLVSLAVSVIALGLIFSKKYQFNIFLGIVSGLLIYILAGVAVMHLSYIVYQNFSLVYLILSLIVAVYAFNNDVKLSEIRFTIRDCLHGVLLASVFVFLTIPLLGASDSKTLEFLHLGGEDNSSQFQMYHYVVKEHAFAYDNDPSNSGIRQTLTSYPQGSHAALSLLTTPFINDVNNTAELLKKYAFGFSFFYSVFIYLIFAVCLLPLRKIKNKTVLLLSETAVGSGVLIFGGLGIFLDLFIYGFFGHIMAYLGLMVILFWISIALNENKRAVTFQFETLVFALLGFFLVYSSWYILAPVAIIPIVLYVIIHRKLMVEKYRLGLGLIMIPVMLCAYLTYIYLFTSTSTGHILTPGGVVKLEPWWLLFALPAAAVGIVAYRKKQWFNLSLSVAVVAAAAFSLLIGIYHYKKLGHLDYYFYKTTYTVLLLVIILFTANLVSASLSILEKIKRVDLGVIVGVITVCLFTGGLLVHISSTTKSYYEQKYTLTQESNGRILDLLLDNPTKASSYQDTFFIGSCDPYINYLGMIWSNSFNISYHAGRDSIESMTLSGKSNELINSMHIYASQSKKPIKVYVIGSCDTEIVSRMENDRKFALEFALKP
jgi:hypothetical protein